MSYEDERAEQIAVAEAHLRDMVIVDAMDSALYNFNPSLHEEAPGFAHAVFVLMRTYSEAVRRVNDISQRRSEDV